MKSLHTAFSFAPPSILSLTIIGTGAICDSMGKWYKMDELPKEYEELVNCYKIVQYNNVFDRKNRVDSVFDLN